MTVINPNSISGVASVTAQGDIIQFYKSDGTLGAVQFDGANFNTTSGVSTFNNLYVGGVLTYEDVKNVDAIGIVTAREGIFLPDSKKLQLGNAAGSSDLEIYHDSNHNNIKCVNGNLRIWSNSSSEAISCIAGAQVTLSHGNTVRLSTTGSGIDVTGKVGINKSNPSVELEVRGSGANGQIYLGGTGAHSQIYADNDGALILSADQGNSASNSYAAVYVDNSEKLRIDSAGRVGVGTITPHSSYRFDIRHTSDSILHLGQNNNTLTGMVNNSWNVLSFQGTNCELGLYKDSSGDFSYIMGTYQGSVNIPLVFRTGNRVERLRITSDGDVGIGTDSPSYRLQVHNSDGALFRVLTGHEGTYDLRYVYQNSEANIWSYGSTDLTFGTRYNKKLHLVTNGPGKRLTIDGSGKTGIGTVTPDTLLHLFSTVQSYLRLETSSNSTYTGVAMRGNTGTDFQIWKQSSNTTAYGGANSGCIWQSEADHPICFFQASTQRMTINSSGNIAIGDGHSGASDRAVSIRDVNCILELTTQGNTSSNYTQIGFKDETANNTSWIWRQPVSTTNYGGAESWNFWHASTHADTSISFFTAGVSTPALKIVANGTTEFHRNNVYIANSLTIGNNHSSPAYDINIDNNNNHAYIVATASQSDGSKLSGIQLKTNNGNSQFWRNGTSSSASYGGANATVIYSSDGDTNFYNATTQTANISNTTDLWTFPNSPLFSGYGFAGNGTQTAGNVYAMKPSTTVINRGSDMNTTTGVFTCPVAGVYEVLGHANRRASYNLWWGIYVIHNGNTISASWWPPITGDGGSFSATHFTYSPLTISHMISCSANDTLSFCYHASYSAPTGGVSDNSWTIRWVQ